MLTERSQNAKDKRTAENGVRLEHRHFAFIAATIALITDDAERERTAKLFAAECRRTNPKFSNSRLYAACKV